jgi:hydroxypyruvate isomerase
MELFNSKVNHPDAQADHTKFLVDICKLVDSPRVKILFDTLSSSIIATSPASSGRPRTAVRGH